MGEPVIGSLVCGSIALVMVIWNWRIMEDQKHRGRMCAKEAARVAQARAKAQHLAISSAHHYAAQQTQALGSPHCLLEEEVSTYVPAAAPSKSSRQVEELESLPEWSESSPRHFDFVTKDARERFETASMSPPLSSARSRSGTGYFFADGAEMRQALDCRRVSLEEA